MGVFDAQRTARTLEITDDAKAWIVSIACQRPTELGYAQELWTLTSLHKHIQKHAADAGFPRLATVTKPYIQKFLKEQDIKPFKIKYYCEKCDPDFESKIHDVLLVYKQIEMQFDENGNLIVPDDYKLTITVSYDEKTGIQAISKTALCFVCYISYNSYAAGCPCPTRKSRKDTPEKSEAFLFPDILL